VLTCLCKKTPPPLCDFTQWLDTEQSEVDKLYVKKAARDARERWQCMVEAENKEKNAKSGRRKFAFDGR
jgi:hypothetical protein